MKYLLLLASIFSFQASAISMQLLANDANCKDFERYMPSQTLDSVSVRIGNIDGKLFSKTALKLSSLDSEFARSFVQLEGVSAAYKAGLKVEVMAYELQDLYLTLGGAGRSLFAADKSVPRGYSDVVYNRKDHTFKRWSSRLGWDGMPRGPDKPGDYLFSANLERIQKFSQRPREDLLRLAGELRAQLIRERAKVVDLWKKTGLINASVDLNLWAPLTPRPLSALLQAEGGVQGHAAFAADLIDELMGETLKAKSHRQYFSNEPASVYKQYAKVERQITEFLEACHVRLLQNAYARKKIFPRKNDTFSENTATAPHSH